MKVHSEIYGDSKFPTIIFVHGAGGSSATWMMQLRGLSKEFNVIAIDLNGHGKTKDRREVDTTKSYLRDIDEIVSKYDRPILAGHSMGGMLTQLYALSNPERIRGIILVGTGAKLKVVATIFDMLENDFDGYVEAAGKFMFHENTPTDIVEASQIEIRKCKPEIISRDFKACNEFDIMNRVSEIDIPTLIVVGKGDLMTPIKYSEYLHKNIQRSTFKVIENAGHAVMLEQSHVFNTIVKDWIKQL